MWPASTWTRIPARWDQEGFRRGSLGCWVYCGGNSYLVCSLSPSWLFLEYFIVFLHPPECNNTEESDVCIKRESLNLFSLFSLTSLCLFVSCDHKKQFFIEIRSHVLVVELEVVLD